MGGMWRRPKLRPEFEATPEPAIYLTPETLAPTEGPLPTIVERGHATVTKILDTLRRDEIALVGEIADREKRLRETRVSIEAFELAEEKLSAGADRHLHSANSNAADGPEAA